MNDRMGETGFSRESSAAPEIVLSETEMAAAEQLMQLSEEETVSCSSSTGGDYGGGRGGGGGGDKTRHEDVVSSRIGNEQNDGVRCDSNLGLKRKREMAKMKEKKFRSLESIYRATKEMRG
ncbi:PREDICTED: uncharacterized protein LOC104702722 [Camelina sativa]|uniref:Uncharacterized protein LOC104702721 n=1 Tax=Camelina sativa TaxID=90675 RepID=A0ABM0SW01_CAMSA|nr:PREDICTED: uncharacterized protein LOC104702721 [Camelina sativa]XP_010416933.1 PREDICTED: uncharacterized protein LOC104702722 [Camelina sativa]